MTSEPVPSPAGGIESAASVAPGLWKRETPPEMETMNATRSSSVTFDGIDTMEVGRDRQTAWVRMDGVSFQFTRGDDGVIEVDAYADRGGEEPMKTMRVPTIIRTRVSVTVEVEVDTSPGDDPIMRAVRAVRDGEGTVVAHEIVK